MSIPVPEPAHESALGAVRAHLPIVAAGGIAFVAFEAYAVARRDASAASYAVFMTLLFGAAVMADRRVGFSTPLLWCLVVWAVLHMAGGLVSTGDGRALYNRSLGVPGLHYDRVVHAFGFGVATVACWQALRRLTRAPSPTTALLVLSALAGLGLGALNETAEFIMSRVATTSVGGYRNTGFDLISNTIGATVAAVWIFLREGARGPAAASADRGGTDG